MSGNRAAYRYAKALLSAAQEQQVAQYVFDDMVLISESVKASTDLEKLLESAVVKGSVKLNALKAGFPEVNSLTVKLFELLDTNNRMALMSHVAKAFIEAFDSSQGKITAQVTTAVPMTPALETQVLTKIKALTNKTVNLEQEVDPSIVGGFILRIGDQQYDASITNQLNQLERVLTSQ
ncbi:MAG: ATP synthase F1 subunit delta [Bacteroidetes bacterium]|nr:ATP synthase F1 subunit delta [Bacteroidota bacterium]MDA0879012.1 ATP synthase F1 subunit delta [Bacteroidota bacterium]MDA1115919.1 ATP synthase F1 subunit delta [Bacteroidota bacterium]